MRTASRFTITGLVQGVGFRPFVHRLAVEHEVAGWVRNRAGQVEIHAEGESAALDAFSAAIPRQLPPLAYIESMVTAFDDADGEPGFRILDSRDAHDAPLSVPADAVTCDACAEELFDPTNRRYRYAFITCTDCGPRYTVIDALPYDRERTSMRSFTMCAQCQHEYESPTDRRFHAESIACAQCGPHLFVHNRGAVPTHDEMASTPSADDDVLRECASVLLAGRVVALRGIGGFHLAVDATNEDAVALLRARKQRHAKPLACMFRTVEQVKHWTAPTITELSALTSRERPVVLLARRHAALPALAPGLSPGLDRIGAMLPSTPLHHLLLEQVGRPLVMTSGNLADEPLATTNAEARRRLDQIADTFLLHDREIVACLDDSVLRLSGSSTIIIRRARGYAPLPLSMPVKSPVPLLAVGAHFKNTFALVNESTAYVSPHIGDLDSLEALAHWKSVRDRYESLFRVTPQAFVADEHEGYLSTRIASEAARDLGAPLIRVQHHHAHVAAVAAEHGVTDQVLGLAFDGTGAGSDGTVWGMEFLVANLLQCERVGHLLPAPLPGGDAAVRAPWRTLAGYMSLDPHAFAAFTCTGHGVSAAEQSVVVRQIARSLNTPLASSAGRLFDAVASLLGVCDHVAYEGQAAMQLEACAANQRGATLPFPVCNASSGLPALDPVPLLTALFERKASGFSVNQLAADFHQSFAVGAFNLTMQLAETHNLRTIVLGGGCFQNARLLTQMRVQLVLTGFDVLVARALPANDGGVSYGQGAIAAARLAHDSGLLSNTTINYAN